MRPATNPSPATISSITAGGTGESVVIAIAASRPLAVVGLRLAAHRRRDDVDAVAPNTVPTRPIMPGTSR